MSHIEEFQRWIKEVMSKIIENLGSNVDEARYELSEPTDYTMSTLYYINLQFKNRTNGQSEELPIVLKRPIHLEIVRQLSRTDQQFHNEILFYQMYIQPGENFAECIYADERPPVDSMIALKNVNERGYRPCLYIYNAPLEYTLAAFREMGRFHGKGYVMKELQREKFFNIVKQIQEVRYDTMDSYRHFVNIITPRTVEYLRSHGHDIVFCDKMEAILSNAFNEVMMKAVKPLEPLSTLCHGDFTLNNILFKVENDGQYRAMLIDFALFRYSTPVVDLSTYLCLCCSNEIRKDKFSVIMQAYHDALKEYLLEANIWDKEKYSYEALLDDFRRGGLFGFVIASFFLPILMGYSDRDTLQLVSMEFVERAKIMKLYGGDEMSKILADTLLHLRDLGCLEYF